MLVLDIQGCSPQKEVSGELRKRAHAGIFWLDEMEGVIMAVLCLCFSLQCPAYGGFPFLKTWSRAQVGVDQHPQQHVQI